MRRFFYPQSIAVAGVSPEKDRVNNIIIENLMEMGYPGEIFAVGRRPGEIFGKPIYTSIEEIHKSIDLLVIMVPAAAVPALLIDAGKAGIERVIILSGGFNESGGEGERLAKEVKEIADKYSIRFIGPNCQGIICTNSRVCLPFGPLSKEQVKEGGVSIINQSGSVGWVGASVLSLEMDGVSKIASIGNKLNVDELDLLEYLIDDPETRIIVIYLESLADGRRLFEIAKKSPKPVIVFKSNIGGKESKLAISHTAALASDDRIVDAALNQAGILRAYNFRQMIEMCKSLSLPIIKGDKLVVLASSGGMGIIGEDTVRRENLHLANLPGPLIREINSKLDWKIFNITNPIDIGGIFNNLAIVEIIDSLLSFNDVNGAVLSIFKVEAPTYRPLTSFEVVDHVERLVKKHLKPIAMHFASDFLSIAPIKKSKSFPLFHTIEDAVVALSTQWKYRKILERVRSPYRNMTREKIEVREILADLKDDSRYPGDLLSLELARRYGIECEIPVLAADLDEARLKAAEIGYPVVMKISSPDIAHKSDVGGVKVNIRDEKELEKSFFEIMRDVQERDKQVRIQGVMLQRMIFGGLELIFGGKYDRDFGPVIMFGMGGIFVETLKDVSFRLAPICREEAYEMIEETKSFPLLQGVRGEKAYDIPSLVDALERFSLLLADFPQIVELDLNPVKLFPERKGLIAVDGRLKITNSQPESLAG